MGFETWTKEALQELNARHPGGSKPRPSEVRSMTEVERAWIGAFVEADGCAFIRRFKDNRSDRMVVTASQKEIDPMATFLRVTGVGNIRLDASNMWVWTADRMNDALNIATQCAPYSWKLQRVLEEV